MKKTTKKTVKKTARSDAPKKAHAGKAGKSAKSIKSAKPTGAKKPPRKGAKPQAVPVDAGQAKLNAAQQAAKDFSIEVARLAADTRCHSVLDLDVRGISPITDFIVIATGTSDRQMRGVLDEIEELALSRGFRAAHRAVSDENWCLIDFTDVIVHVFSQDARLFYELENLWGDAPRLAWEREAVGV